MHALMAGSAVGCGMLFPHPCLRLLADDPAAEEDLTRFAKRAGHEMVAVEDKGDHKRFLIRRGE